MLVWWKFAVSSEVISARRVDGLSQENSEPASDRDRLLLKCQVRIKRILISVSRGCAVAFWILAPVQPENRETPFLSGLCDGHHLSYPNPGGERSGRGQLRLRRVASG